MSIVLIFYSKASNLWFAPRRILYCCTVYRRTREHEGIGTSLSKSWDAREWSQIQAEWVLKHHARSTISGFV